MKYAENTEFTINFLFFFCLIKENMKQEKKSSLTSVCVLQYTHKNNIY